MKHYDVMIIGAGAAGMMCAIEAGKRGRSVLIIDHAKKAGDKIRISGGGRCNFTNINTKFEGFYKYFLEHLHGRPKVQKRTILLIVSQLMKRAKKI